MRIPSPRGLRREVDLKGAPGTETRNWQQIADELLREPSTKEMARLLRELKELSVRSE